MSRDARQLRRRVAALPTERELQMVREEERDRQQRHQQQQQMDLQRASLATGILTQVSGTKENEDLHGKARTFLSAFLDESHRILTQRAQEEEDEGGEEQEDDEEAVL
jgi:hypothetical protein